MENSKEKSDAADEKADLWIEKQTDAERMDAAFEEQSVRQNRHKKSGKRKKNLSQENRQIDADAMDARNGHKFLTKNCKKSLDFSSQDEYNTLSTQENRVLNIWLGTHEVRWDADQVLNLYLL